MEIGIRLHRACAVALVVAGCLLAPAIARADIKGELSYSERVPGFDTDGTRAVAFAPTGPQVYVAGGTTISVLDRDNGTGAISLLETETDGVDDLSDAGATPEIFGTEDIEISPDGKFLYTASDFFDDGIAIFSRDPLDGRLSFVDRVNTGSVSSGAADIAISADGTSLYAAASGNKAVAFSRDATTGALTEVNAITDNTGGANGLAGAEAIAVAPDGDAVYVAGRNENAVAVLDRNSATSALTFNEAQLDGTTVGSGGTVDGLSNVNEIIVSPDDDTVYTTSFFDSSVAIFDRDTTDEKLDYLGQAKNGVGGVTGMANANEAAVTPDGDNLYVAGQQGTVAVFSRDTGGALTFLEAEVNGADDATDPGPAVSGLNTATAMAVAPSGNFAAAGGPSGLSAFAVGGGAGKLTFIGTAPGLSVGNVRGVALTPDGAHVFTATNGDNALRSFSRDPLTGGITLLDEEFEGVDDPSDPAPAAQGLYEAKAVTVSPDGRFVYVTDTSDYSVSTYSFDPSTGELAFVEFEANGVDDGSDSGGTVDGLYEPHDVIVSPDGASVYAPGDSDDSLTAFARNAATGRLNYVETEFDGVGGVDGLASSRGVAITPDGTHVYAAGAGEDSVSVFSRNATTSALTYHEIETEGVNDPSDPGGTVAGLQNPRSLEVSPDGRFLYVIASAAVTTFSIDPATGRLSFVETETDGVNDPTDAGGTVEGLGDTSAIGISADGEEVYVASGSSPDATVATFQRNPTTGKLSFLEVESQGIDDPDDAGGIVAGLRGTEDLAIAPDDRHVYFAAETDTSITIFDRQDDFLAPDTTIAGGPAEGSTTKDSTPSFTFTSNESPVTFECSVDGGSFAVCPASLAKLGDGRHDLEARAVDSQGNKDASPASRGFTVDTKVSGSKIKAKKTQKIKGSKVKIEIKLKAKESAEGLGKGKVTVGKKSYKLKQVEKNLKSDKQKKLKLKTKKSKDARKIAKALKKKGKKAKKVKAKLTGKITDDAGNKVSEKLTVKLKKK